MSWLELKLEGLKAWKIPQLVELDKICLGGIWTFQGYERELNSPNSHFIILHIMPEDKIIGYGCFWAILEEAHITLLVVHPNYRNQGLGFLLLYQILKKARELKLERATLEVREKNEVALCLYQKFGFKIAGKRPKYYQATGEDALILWYGDLAKTKFTTDEKEWQQAITERLAQNKFYITQT